MAADSNSPRYGRAGDDGPRLGRSGRCFASFPPRIICFGIKAAAGAEGFFVGQSRDLSAKVATRVECGKTVWLTANCRAREGG